MRTIYIDEDFKCYTEPGDTLVAVETEFFDGKCDTYIEGYRFLPAGKTWVRPDGAVFGGEYEMVTPWKPLSELEAAQAQYEKDRASLEESYREGVNSL
jgi:hypothetical protein